MSKKALKTPLRYPGGKSRACTKMGQFFPDFSKYKQFREPFLGGGSVALYISKMYPSLDIWVNDLYEPLVNFWQVLQDDANNLYEKLCNLTHKEMKITFSEYCALHDADYKPPAPAIQLHLNYEQKRIKNST